MSSYIFDNAGKPASQRFTSLETLYDSPPGGNRNRHRLAVLGSRRG